MHWDLRMGPRQAGLWAMCSPGSWEAPSPRRAAQQPECSPAALHQHRAHQGNQPSLSGSVPKAHFSVPLTPSGAEHSSSARMTPCLPPWGTCTHSEGDTAQLHSSLFTRKICQVAFPNSASRQHIVPARRLRAFPQPRQGTHEPRSPAHAGSPSIVHSTRHSWSGSARH